MIPVLIAITAALALATLAGWLRVDRLVMFAMRRLWLQTHPAITAKFFARRDRFAARCAGAREALAAFDTKALFRKITLAAMSTNDRRHPFPLRFLAPRMTPYAITGATPAREATMRVRGGRVRYSMEYRRKRSHDQAGSRISTGPEI